MAFADCFQADSLATAGPVGMTLLQKSKTLVKETISTQTTKLRLKRVLYMTLKQSNTIHDNLETNSEGFVNRYMSMKTRLAISRGPIHQVIPERNFPNSLPRSYSFFILKLIIE